ncbi:MAG: hypothetical protein ACR2JB_10940 [Bryobacteraceae bacterium]
MFSGSSQVIDFMERETGIEPATSSLASLTAFVILTALTATAQTEKSSFCSGWRQVLERAAWCR